MTKSPSIYYPILLITLIVMLTGCELRRDNGEIGDPAPVSDLPPTLAPLGAETTLDTAAKGAGATINAEATATLSNLSEGQAAANPAEPALPTSEAVDLTGPSAVTTNAAEGAADAFASPTENAATTVTEGEQAIVVDATTSNDLPIGGPVAANPPGNQTTDSYNAPAYAADGTYTVQAGDTLFGVAQRYGTTVQALVAANGLANDVIYAGQVLNISGVAGNNFPSSGYEQPTYQPGSGEYLHIVAPGETLFAIALQYGTSVDILAVTNQVSYPYTISVGQELLIPANSGYAEEPQGNYGPTTDNYPAPETGYQPAPGDGNFHVVAPGETLFSLAMRYGSSVESIAGANGIPFPYTIGIGQQLLVPAPGAYAGPPPPANGFAQQPQEYYPPSGAGYGVTPGNFQPPVDNFSGLGGTHTIAPGETIFSIAAFYGINAEALAAANGLTNPNQVFVGQVLYLP